MSAALCVRSFFCMGWLRAKHVRAGGERAGELLPVLGDLRIVRSGRSGRRNERWSALEHATPSGRCGPHATRDTFGDGASLRSIGTPALPHGFCTSLEAAKLGSPTQSRATLFL